MTMPRYTIPRTAHCSGGALTMAWLDWYPHALASVSEGICPEHLTALDRNDGWCPACKAWWSIRAEDDGPHVITSYPVPLAGGTHGTT